MFLQGDHYQANAKKFGDPTTREPELTAIRELCVEALGAGVLNIDIDPSTLVKLERPTLTEQQRENYELCAYYSRLIRQKQPKGALVSVGGEIGEVGTKNSTVEELRAFMQGYLTALGQGEVGISKISVQSGTSHGGVPLAGGGVAQVKLDFKTLEELSKVARDEFGMAGAVQHGASTLPTELFHHFPKTETAEIHLATEFQNMVFDHPAFPPELKEKIVTWCVSNCSDEREPDQTDSQFLYKTRKKAWGPFKHELWTLPEKETILGELEGRFSFLWKQLNVVGSRSMVQNHVRPVPFSLPWPINFSLVLETQASQVARERGVSQTSTRTTFSRSSLSRSLNPEKINPAMFSAVGLTLSKGGVSLRSRCSKGASRASACERSSEKSMTMPAESSREASTVTRTRQL